MQPHIFCVHCAQVGSRGALTGCAYETARNKMRYETDEVSRPKSLSPAIEVCGRMRVYVLLWPYCFCPHWAEVSDRAAVSGCGYGAARDGKKCETFEVRRLNVCVSASER